MNKEKYVDDQWNRLDRIKYDLYHGKSLINQLHRN